MLSHPALSYYTNLPGIQRSGSGSKPWSKTWKRTCNTSSFSTISLLDQRFSFYVIQPNIFFIIIRRFFSSSHVFMSALVVLLFIMSCVCELLTLKLAKFGREVEISSLSSGHRSVLIYTRKNSISWLSLTPS